MNKKVFLILAIGLMIGFPLSVFALNIPNPLGIYSVTQLIQKITQFIYVAAIIGAPLLIMIAAFLRITAGGREERIKKSNAMITWSIIGLVVILLSRIILSIIKTVLL